MKERARGRYAAPSLFDLDHEAGHKSTYLGHGKEGRTLFRLFFMCAWASAVTASGESNSRRDRSRKQITKFFSFFGDGRGRKEKKSPRPPQMFKWERRQRKRAAAT